MKAHGFRHTRCSSLFEADAKIEEVQDCLRHTEVKTTMNIYAHVSKEAKEGAIQKSERYLNN
nr:tyrosine-type recombinase/integrase [Sporosarcina sp. P2]